MKYFESLFLGAVVTACIIIPCTAQPLPGNILVSDYGSVSDINVLDRSTNQVTTLIGFSWISPIDDVIMAANNIDMRASLGGSITSHAFWRVTPQGSTMRLVSVPGVAGFFVAGYDLDQNGAYPIASPAGGVYRAVGNALSTLYTAAASHAWHKIAVDQDSSDYLAVNSFGTALMIDRLTGQATTFATGLGAPRDVAFDQRTGGFWIAGSGIQRFDRAGQVVATLTTTPTNAVTVDQVSGNVFGIATNGLTEYDRAGTAVNTWTGLGSYPTGVTIYAHRSVAPGNDGVSTAPGATYPFVVSFPLSGFSGYCCALSLSGMRPGIPLPAGRTLNIALDDLFKLTACRDLPGLTTGFSGTLDGFGAATGSFKIPAAVPSGTRITLAAVAINLQLPGSLDVGEAMNIVVD